MDLLSTAFETNFSALRVLAADFVDFTVAVLGLRLLTAISVDFFVVIFLALRVLEANFAANIVLLIGLTPHLSHDQPHQMQPVPDIRNHRHYILLELQSGNLLDALSDDATQEY